MAYNKPIDPQWITQGINTTAVDWANTFAKHLVPKDQHNKVEKDAALSTSQLRKFFGQLRRIQADYERLKVEVPLLKPKLAYAVGKAKKENRIRDFYDQMEIGFKCLDGDKEKFNRFISLTEAIVAYHKFHGGE